MSHSLSLRAALSKSRRLLTASLKILPTGVCAALLMICPGSLSMSFAQSTGQTLFIPDRDLKSIESEIERGCKGNWSKDPFVSVETEFKLSSAYSPISEAALDKLREQWSALPWCKTDNAAAAPPAEPPTLPALETTNPGGAVRPQDQVASGGTFGQPNTFGITSVTVDAGFDTQMKTLTFKSPTDEEKFHVDTNQFRVGDQINFGPFFVYSSLGFGGMPQGNGSDSLFAFPIKIPEAVNSGSTYDVTANAGYKFLRGPQWDAGIYGGYYLNSNALYGTVADSPMVGPLIIDRWQAAQGGLFFEKTFLDGAKAVSIRMDVAGMAVSRQATGFDGTGGGVTGSFNVSFPLPVVPIRGTLFVLDTYMNVSGSSFGVPITATSNNLTVGGGLTIYDSDIAASLGGIRF
jgi:hypothetical protein